MVMSVTRAAVTKDAGSTAVQEFEVPDPGEGALFEIEAAGICGADMPKFFGDLKDPVILGHENVGRVVAGSQATIDRWDIDLDRRYLMEEYVPCGMCRSCRTGRYRACKRTNSRDPKALRYGTTPITRAPHLWGGFSQIMYLDPNTVLHLVPESVSSASAAFALPLSNGVQWMLYDAGVQAGESVLIEGPGQQGLACLIAAKTAGCGPIIVSGLEEDRPRLEIAKKLGADEVLIADKQNVASEVKEIVGAEGIDVVADVSGAGKETIRTAFDAVRRGGRVVMAGARGDDIPGLKGLLAKEITLRGVRGHGYVAVETALAWLANGSVDMTNLHEPTYGLDDVGEAFKRLDRREAVHLVIDPRK